MEKIAQESLKKMNDLYPGQKRYVLEGLHLFRREFPIQKILQQTNARFAQGPDPMTESVYAAL